MFCAMSPSRSSFLKSTRSNLPWRMMNARLRSPASSEAPALDAAERDGNRLLFADEFPHFLHDLLASLGEREAPDVDAGQDVEIDFSIGPDGRAGARRHVAQHFNLEHVAGSEAELAGR